MSLYIDGFNLYYGSLKGTPHKWLDPVALVKQVLPRERDHIGCVKYFTARVSNRSPGDSVARDQQTYLRAIELHCPELEIIYGHFLTHPSLLPLAADPATKVRVIKTEEKGSDVNLAVHLLNDARDDAYDLAVLVSNDGDLAEAVRLTQAAGKPVGIIFPLRPGRKRSTRLPALATFSREIWLGALTAAQLPNPIPGTAIAKPGDW